MTNGFFRDGEAFVEIELNGAAATGKTFDCLIDTGFVGFLSIPLVEAFPLGLILRGTNSYRLADDKTQTRLLAFGRVTFEGRTEVGSVVLDQQGGQALLGMDFFRVFGLELVINAVRESVTLTSGRIP